MNKWLQLYYGITIYKEGAKVFAAQDKEDSALSRYLLSLPNKIRIVIYANMSFDSCSSKKPLKITKYPSCMRNGLLQHWLQSIQFESA